MPQYRLAANSPRSLRIRAAQVHDWCYKNSTTTLTLADLALPNRMAEVAGVECAISNFTCGVVARSTPVAGIMVVTLRKQVTLTITFIDGEGEPLSVTSEGQPVLTQTRTRFWDEFVKIAAPEAAEIHCELTDAGCRSSLVSTGGATAVQVEVFDIQSIAAEEEVRLQIEGSGLLSPAKAKRAARPYIASRV